MSIKELELDFDPNMIMAITGFNGSGKSSLLYAIATCISGFRKGETYRDYVKLGEDYATIQLDATLSDKPIHYDIQIAADGTMIEDGVTDESTDESTDTGSAESESSSGEALAADSSESNDSSLDSIDYQLNAAIDAVKAQLK